MAHRHELTQLHCLWRGKQVAVWAPHEFACNTADGYLVSNIATSITLNYKLNNVVNPNEDESVTSARGLPYCLVPVSACQNALDIFYRSAFATAVAYVALP